MRLELMLKLEQEAFMEDKVKVMITHDISELFTGETFLKLGKGMEVEVPRWLAEYLVSKGYAKFVKEITLNDILKKVSSYNFLEKKNLDDYPKDIDKKLYKYVRLILKRFEEADIAEVQDKKSLIIQYMNLEKLKSQIVELANVRLLKSLRLMLGLGEVPVDLIERLAPEELAIINEIKDDITVWKENVLGVNE